MGSAQMYRQNALECLSLAEVSRNQATQESMVRLAELWARLADRNELPSAYAQADYENRAT
jgi:hypothetical protein